MNAIFYSAPYLSLIQQHSTFILLYTILLKVQSTHFYSFPCVPCYSYNTQCYMTMNIRYGAEWNGTIGLGVMVLKRVE